MLRAIVAVVEKRNPTTNPAARKLEPRFCVCWELVAQSSVAVISGDIACPVSREYIFRSRFGKVVVES